MMQPMVMAWLRGNMWHPSTKFLNVHRGWY